MHISFMKVKNMGRILQQCASTKVISLDLNGWRSTLFFIPCRQVTWTKSKIGAFCVGANPCHMTLLCSPIFTVSELTTLGLTE